MKQTVRAPRLGEGVEELTIGKIFIGKGDQVDENQSLMELESDKVVSELNSPLAGMVSEIFVREGDRVQVGTPLINLETESEGSAEAAGQKSGEQSAEQTVKPLGAQPAEQSGEQPAEQDSYRSAFLSPLARKLIKTHGLDPAKIRGTGLGGRIMKQDILDYLKQNQRPALVPHSTSRKRIAERMLRSMHNAAPVLTVMEADLSAVLHHRSLHKEPFARDGVRLTLSAYFVQAAALALGEYPLVNASWTDAGMEYHEDINIGMAVALGSEGLMVPVIRHADQLSLKEIAIQIADLANRARNRTLSVDDVRGATFSVTNHGTGGSLFATPVIVEGHTGILGIGAMQKRPIVIEAPDGSDAISIRPMVYLSFVFDHRVMDGEGADSFLKSVKEKLEHWT